MSDTSPAYRKPGSLGASKTLVRDYSGHNLSSDKSISDPSKNEKSAVEISQTMAGQPLTPSSNVNGAVASRETTPRYSN